MAFIIGGGITIGTGISFIDGAAAPAANDPYFEYVTTLLQGDGTNGAQNNTFVDSSTNNFTITRNGTPTQGSFSPYSSGWSNYFDGTGDYLATPVSDAFTFGTGPFTIEAWINPAIRPPSTVQWIYGNMTTGTGNTQIGISITTTGLLQLQTWNSVVTITTSAIPLNAWTHIAAAFDGTTYRLFINGILSASSTTIFTLSTNGSGTVGHNGTLAGNQLFTGYISNLRVVKGTAVYTTAFTPSTTPLTAIAKTSLLTCADNRFIDESANNFTITRNGDVKIQSFSPFAGTTLPTPYYGAYFGTKTNSLSIPATTALTTFTGNFTFECWVYPTNAAVTYWGIWDARQAGSTANPMIFSLAPLAAAVSGSYRMNYYNGTSYNGTGVVVMNQWTHVAFVRVGTTLTFYINGVAGGTATVSGTQTGNATTNPVYIGSKDSNLPQYGTVGHISNFRIVNGTAVYTANFTPSTTPLTAIANTSLLACQSSTFIDNSTNNYVVSVVGNTCPSTFAPFAVTYSTPQSYSPSVFGGSMYFNGTGDYLSTPDNVAFSLGTSDFTFECWVYPTAITAGNNNILAQWGSGNAWIFRYIAAGRIQFSGAATNVTGTTTAVVINQWNHVAITRNSSTVRLFVNGVLDATTGTIGALTDSTSQVTVGAYSTGTSEYVTGYISNLRLINGTALYTTSFVPSTQPLAAVANTSLLLNTVNAGIFDNAMMNDLVTVGNAQVSTAVKKYGAGSMAFDGSGDYLMTPSIPALAFGSGNFTIEGWVYANSWGFINHIIDFRPASTNGAYPQLYIDSAGKFAFGNPVNITGTTVISTGVWYYIAVCRSGTSTRMFVNGIQEGATYTDTTIYLVGASRPAIGSNGFTAGQTLWDGYMDDIRITTGVARYTANFTPPTESLPNN